MKIAFFGLPIAALLLHADGHTLVFAGTSRRGAIGTRRLIRTIGQERVRVVPKVDDPAVQRAVAASGADLLVSWFWTTKLTGPILHATPLGGFGVHPSLLPKHRGADPYFWTIDQGDIVTGVTAHRLALDYDTGAILGQKTLPIDPSWNAWRLAKRLDRPSLALLREVAAAFARGAPPPDVAQDEAQATEAPAVDDALLEIDWTETVDAILRRVRAAAPWPGAYTFVGASEEEEAELTITRAEKASAKLASLAPGEAAVWNGQLTIRAADGALAILEGRVSDDEGNETTLAGDALLAFAR